MLYEIRNPLDADIKTDSEAFNEAAAFIKALSRIAQELVEMIQEEVNTNPLLEIDEFSADSNTLDYDLAAEMSKASTTLIDELLMQLHTCRHVENPLLCEFIIYSLDNNGYLTLSVEETPSFVTVRQRWWKMPFIRCKALNHAVWRRVH